MNKRGSSFWSSGSVPLIEPEILSSIIAAASDIALVVGPDRQVLSVLLNTSDDYYGKLDHWEGRNIAAFLTSESVPKFEDAFARFADGGDLKKQIELNHTDNAVWEFPIRYTFHRLGSDGTVLLLGRDLRPIAETQQQLVQAQIALEKGYEARREFDARYRILLANTREATLFLSVRDGRIKDLNQAAATLLGLSKDSAEGSPLAQALKDRASAELTESLLNASMAEDEGSVVVETRSGRQALRILPIVFRAAGDRIMLCRILPEDQTGTAEDQTTGQLTQLFQRGVDGILFTDLKGVIINANESFLELIDAAHLADVRGRPLSDFLARGQIDLGMLTDNSERAGQVRVYATRLVSDYGAKVAVEISATKLAQDTAPCIAFVIRDVSRVEAVRATHTTTPEEANRNVMELVGSASLKEIVSETTDVVEKMCIETAVNLTRNNRVAAAEMLGLSRQSLYVKLRKYGLLSKD